MGGCISIINSTQLEQHVVLSQVGPLHDALVDRHRRRDIGCGKVWFTVQCQPWRHGDKRLSGWDVFTPIAMISAAVGLTLLAGALIFVPGVGEAVGLAAVSAWLSTNLTAANATKILTLVGKGLGIAGILNGKYVRIPAKQTGVYADGTKLVIYINVRHEGQAHPGLGRLFALRPKEDYLDEIRTQVAIVDSTQGDTGYVVGDVRRLFLDYQNTMSGEDPPLDKAVSKALKKLPTKEPSH